MTIEVRDADGMRRLGIALADAARPGDLIVLTGELGAGKTTLTQGVGAGLGVSGDVLSPTFVIARVHRGGRIPLVHADAYRLGSVEEFVLQTRRRVAEQLAVRVSELAAEREVFAQESVRYERVRIARELHDIVAHCVSVMVIQAAAGQRLAAESPELAEQAVQHIADAVRQAQTEMSRLVEMLAAIR